jgi:hypothetical protein
MFVATPLEPWNLMDWWRVTRILLPGFFNVREGTIGREVQYSPVLGLLVSLPAHCSCIIES